MIKSKKGIILIIAIALLGLILIIASNFTDSESTESIHKIDQESYTTKLENKIKDFLLRIDGINKAEVIVTLDTSNEQIYAQNQSTLDYLIINSNNGESPVYVTEIYPTVRGIAIACTNGESDEIKMKITKLISAYLGISSNRIEIIGIK